MSFFSLQPGSPVYILNKESVPVVNVGSVISVSQPRPSQQNWQQTLVNLAVDIDGVSRSFENLPSDKEMADSMTGIQIYCNRDMILAEVGRMRKASAQIVNDIDKHKAIVKACDGILCELSPEIAEKAAREKEFKEMKAQLDEMREMFRQAVGAKANTDNTKQL
jgi:hypothetical protein